MPTPSEGSSTTRSAEQARSREERELGAVNAVRLRELGAVNAVRLRELGAVNAVRLRDLAPSDRAPIERILRATAAFTDAEVLVALELVDERPEVGYRFVVAEVDGSVAGYACFGETPCTVGTYDLYWIAVDPARQNLGLGRKLLDAVESAVRADRGRLLVIETASKPAYAATRAFYERCGLELAARIDDFYARGDDKLVYCRRYDT